MKESDLEALGLSTKEAKVYLAVMRNGRMSLSALAEAIKINRTTLYPHLDTLLSEGFIAKTIRGKRTFYVAESPKKIERMLRRKQKHLEALMPGLEHLFKTTSQQPSIVTYEGKSGIDAAFKEAADTALYVKTFLSPGDYYTLLSMKEGNYFLRKAAENEIDHRGLCSDTPEGRKFMKDQKKGAMKIRMMPDSITFPVECMIYNQKVLLVSFEHQFAVVIESPDIKIFLEKLFDCFWELARS